MRGTARGKVSRSPKDTDSAETAHRLRIIAWSIPIMFIGSGIGFFVAALHDAPPLPYMIVVGVGMAVVYAGGTYLVASRAATAGASIYFSSGRSTPARAEYSLAESLAARGLLDEAVREYERHAAEQPRDPEPLWRLARLCRDRLDRPEDAVQWFQQILALETLTPAGRTLASRELVELYVRRLRMPERALPVLARLAERLPGTPDAAWARRELTELKRMVHGDGIDHA